MLLILGIQKTQLGIHEQKGTIINKTYLPIIELQNVKLYVSKYKYNIVMGVKKKYKIKSGKISLKAA